MHSSPTKAGKNCKCVHSTDSQAQRVVEAMCSFGPDKHYLSPHDPNFTYTHTEEEESGNEREAIHWSEDCSFHYTVSLAVNVDIWLGESFDLGSVHRTKALDAGSVLFKELFNLWKSGV